MDNVFLHEGKALVSKVSVTDEDLKIPIKKAIDLIGGLDRLNLERKNVFIKADLETDTLYPGSTDLNFLKAVIELLREKNPKKIYVGECSAPGTNTRMIFQEKGLVRLSVEEDFELVNFEDEEYEAVKTNGVLLNEVSIPKMLKQMDIVIFLPNMKTDLTSRFDLSLKLSLGFLEKMDKVQLEKENPEEKIAELAGAFSPKLIIMDARKAFVEGGPNFGSVKKINLILASGDRIAIDTEALKILKSFKRANNKLDLDVWEFPQIKGAVKLGLGISREEEKEVVE